MDAPQLQAAPLAAGQGAKAPAKKRALLIGINYTGQPAELAGCVNDIVDMRAVCAALKYDEVCVLYDGRWAGVFNPADNRLGDTKPTRANMTAAFRWLVAGASKGDRLLFHYSGHGGQLRALVPGTEADASDETLVPIDYEASGMIRDDELRALLVEPLRGTGAVLRAVLDCCHSGTGMDLKYNLSLTGTSSVWDGTLRSGGAEDAARPDGLQAVVARLTADAVRLELTRWFGGAAVAKSFGDAAAPLEFTEWTDDGVETRLPAAAVEGRLIGALPSTAPDVLVVSGCADRQTSADASFDDRANGALTYYLLAVLRPAIASRAWPTATNFLRDLRRRLRAGGYDQIPQVSSEVRVGPSTKFDLA